MLCSSPFPLFSIRKLTRSVRYSVYLIREVLSASVEEDDLVDPLSPSVDSNPSPSAYPVRPLFHSWASDPFETASPTVFGRSFALKCLCKKDLSDDLIEIQRGEAVLHRALPEHEFIVRLYAVRFLSLARTAQRLTGFCRLTKPTIGYSWCSNTAPDKISFTGSTSDRTLRWPSSTTSTLARHLPFKLRSLFRFLPLLRDPLPPLLSLDHR